MRFSFLTGDMNYTTYGGKWISTRQNNGEFDYYFVIELLNWPETVGQREAPAKLQRFAVCRFAPASRKGNSPRARLLRHYGGNACDGNRQRPARYGASGSAAQLRGLYPGLESRREQLARPNEGARQEARQCEFLFGFYLDRPVNRIGTTGWEALRGDLTSAIDRVCN